MNAERAVYLSIGFSDSLCVVSILGVKLYSLGVPSVQIQGEGHCSQEVFMTFLSCLSDNGRSMLMQVSEISSQIM